MKYYKIYDVKENAWHTKDGWTDDIGEAYIFTQPDADRLTKSLNHINTLYEVIPEKEKERFALYGPKNQAWWGKFGHGTTEIFDEINYYNDGDPIMKGIIEKPVVVPESKVKKFFDIYNQYINVDEIEKQYKEMLKKFEKYE